MRFFLAFLAVLLLLPATAQAATVYGNVYDLSLERVPGALVEVNSTPGQQMVAENGSYMFEVAPGDYLVSSSRLENGALVSSAREAILIVEEGDYRVDLILFPSFEEDEAMFEEAGRIDVGELDFPGEAQDYSLYVLIGVVIVIAVLALVLVKVSRLKPVKEERLPEDLENTLKVIRRQGGRTTQKEIRKALGLSEAKVSLMVADLEERGLVRKIRKGRGNIVTLK